MFLGRISYSLYTFHLPIISVLEPIGWRFISADHYLAAQSLCVCLVLPATIAAATGGFYLIEKPSRWLGRKLSLVVATIGTRQAAATAQAIVAGAPSMVLVPSQQDRR